MASVPSKHPETSNLPSSWDGHTLANAIPDPLIIVDSHDRVSFVNHAAESFFQLGANIIQGQGLNEIIPFDSPMMALVGQVRGSSSSVSEYGLILDGPRTRPQNVDIQYLEAITKAQSLTYTVSNKIIHFQKIKWFE